MALTRVNNQALPTLSSSKMPSGSVLQAKTATKTDTQSTTSNSFTDITGLSVSITPSSTNSKILVLCTVCISSTFYWCPVRVLRDSTQINAPDAAVVDPIEVPSISRY